VVLPSLKDPRESRACWWFFSGHLAGCLRTLYAKAQRGLFLAVRMELRNRFWDSIVTVMFFEVVRAVLFMCGGTPIHPFVNPPA
jgi:hypothetical protein